MSAEDRKGICATLNKTNFKVLAWYTNEKETTEISGLKYVKLVHKLPMKSTGGENFQVYIFVKMKKGKNDCS